MVKRFYGINIAVKDLDEAIPKYSEVLGVKPRLLGDGDFAFPGLKGAELLLGDVIINLIASQQPDTSIARFVENRGEGVFLISLEVTDIEEDMNEMAKSGVNFTTDKPLTFAGGKVAFGHPKSMNGVQIEFFEPKKD